MLELRAVDIRQDDFRLRADLAVATGRKVAVIGPSGAGKSTLLSTIAGFFRQTSGQVVWQGRPLDGVAPGKRPISMLFQDGNLFPHLDIARNIGLGIAPSLRLSEQDRARVEDALQRVGLGGMGGRTPAALSGGQQSRAALARILVQNRPLLLLDEPFAALGPALRAEMLDLVSDLVDETGVTLLMVSHDPADARRIAQDIMLVDDGHAYPPAEAGQMLADPPEALRRYLG
ncbi:ATP-binding cassette domain-containing protein [Pseudooceanicola sediminis]|uniref:ATP-binding cassette domain-containing protein n=1 Tax=Pseudooceanicola sediminis TaxID=2211117 RepID=A0A399IZD4_9RHOB|nr:ATP-binding cassette domain-containing protein [Pseudooceanicola sediminis]KAA2313338.1 ATP-binding cassette domain-containing protein [Puniceibacterium sp. HSS470]RII38380.1 ATP-binding cassette domain-containing protein [Pseudooceanicola sediminis]|tara:strand:+ start:52396 stop:53088 length:693 start_codon:yes stop_codon:yes gene_type:complete